MKDDKFINEIKNAVSKFNVEIVDYELNISDVWFKVKRNNKNKCVSELELREDVMYVFEKYMGCNHKLLSYNFTIE